jgi:hypothetical protein
VNFRGLIVVAVLIGGCTATNSAPQTTTAQSGHFGPCPETIVIHTNEMPTSDVGFLYQLLSTDYSIDPVSQSISAPISSNDTQLSTSRVEIRHGGQVTNFEQVPSIMHSDNSVLLGLVDTDEAIALASSYPTQALFAPFHISPDIIYWNPDLYPTAKDIADHNSWDIRVMYADGAYFMRHLLTTEQLKPPQPVNTFDGTPIPFIASGGLFLQQGLSTVDPYAYRHIYRDWMKDIAYQYIHEAGWQPYAISVSATPANIARYDSCLKVLIPALQQALKDFLTDPEPAIARIVDAARQFNTSWNYSPEQARTAVDIILTDGLAHNGIDNILGSFDLQRASDFLATFRRAFPNISLNDVTAEQFVTNEFLDTTISLQQ